MAGALLAPAALRSVFETASDAEDPAGAYPLHARACGACGQTYRDLQAKVAAKRGRIRDFLVAARRAGKAVLAYGAPAKGNTLLNYCGDTRDLIPFTVDRNPHKQGLLLPGTHLPIRDPAALIAARPDYVFVLPWNLKDEIVAQLAEVRAWGGQFVVLAPDLTIMS